MYKNLVQQMPEVTCHKRLDDDDDVKAHVSYIRYMYGDGWRSSESVGSGPKDCRLVKRNEEKIQRKILRYLRCYLTQTHRERARERETLITK